MQDPLVHRLPGVEPRYFAEHGAWSAFGGGLQDALGKLYDLIDEEDGRKKPRRGRPPKAKLDKEPPAKGAAK